MSLRYKPQKDPLRLRMVCIDRNPLKFFKKEMFFDIRTTFEQSDRFFLSVNLQLRKLVASNCLDIIRFYYSNLCTETNFSDDVTLEDIKKHISKEEAKHLQILSFDTDTIEVIDFYVGFLCVMDLIKTLGIKVKLTVDRLIASDGILDKEQTVTTYYEYDKITSSFHITENKTGQSLEIKACSMYTNAQYDDITPFHLTNKENFEKALRTQIKLEEVFLESVSMHPRYANNWCKEYLCADTITNSRMKRISNAEISGYGASILRSISLEMCRYLDPNSRVYTDKSKNKYVANHNSEQIKKTFRDVISLYLVHAYICVE